MSGLPDQCWADDEESHITGNHREGYEETRVCLRWADPECSLGLCKDHCATTHVEKVKA